MNNENTFFDDDLLNKKEKIRLKLLIVNWQLFIVFFYFFIFIF